jgi:hypothetical protein
MGNLSKLDWNIIDTRVKNALNLRPNSNKSTVFLSLVIEQLFSESLDLTEVITDGSDDRGIDAIHIIENDETSEIYLFQSKYRESFESSKKTINDAEILKINKFILDLFDQSASFAQCNNFKIKENVDRIWKIHAKGKQCKYYVICCSNGCGFAETAKTIIDTFCTNYKSVSFQFYSGHDFISSLSASGRNSTSGMLKVIGKEILERSDGDIRGAIASVDASSFIELILADDGINIKRDLFNDNLRIYLGTKGGYNQSIVNTATSSDAYLFWYLNNGITITCKNFTYNKGHVNPTLRIEDFQIVNGAQTSHSLVEAFQQNNNSLDDVVIMIRIYATTRAEIVERVAVATNSQARIQSRDLRSNADILKKIELAFKERGYYFERKKNMHADKPVEVRVDALKLGQIVLAFYLREPEKSKTDSDSIFDSKFDEIFNEVQNIDELIKLFKVYQYIEKMRQEYEDSKEFNMDTDDNRRYLIYGHWFVLFTFNLIYKNRELKEIPVGKQMEDMVNESVRILANACGASRTSGHYQLFRSSKTKEKIYAEIGSKQLSFFEILKED